MVRRSMGIRVNHPALQMIIQLRQLIATLKFEANRNGGGVANRNFAILLGMGVILCPLAAEADSVTYNFSGTVTSASGLYSALVAGTEVTGTYNFDLANAHAGESVSTSSSWYIQSGTADVFWATIQVGPFSDSTNLSAGPGPNGANNAIFGQAPAAGEPYGWQFGGGAIVGNPDFDSIGFSILAKNGFIPLTSGGLPLFSPAQTYSATGALESQ